MEFSDFDLIIVGAGFYGATIAERGAAAGLKIKVIEKREHIGGNCYSEIEPETGIEIHRYGTHIFHTNSENVWAYLNRFTEFTNYHHRVWTVANGLAYTMPINLGTICSVFGRAMSPSEARAIVAAEAGEVGGIPRSLEEKAISSIGRTLYEKFVRGYTLKQWQTDPKLLPAEIITRLPVRFDFNDRYFADRFEGMPVNGYTEIFRKMLSHPNISVELGTDFFDVRKDISDQQLIVYTGPLDRFYDFKYGELGWRTVDLEKEIHDVPDFQGTAVMNYADSEVPFTRIHEFRHLHPERKYESTKTAIFREYSRKALKKDTPYYPINTETDRSIFVRYAGDAAKETNVLFGGRLGSYKYFDMHQAIGAALKAFEAEVLPFFQNKGSGYLSARQPVIPAG
jgi:UDP-galactopyranose mutase